MSFEGKICGVCNKGKLNAFKQEVSAGVYVDAYRCDTGHISYAKAVMEKLEAMHKATAQERHVLKVGSSIAIPIPAGIAKALGLQPREKVYVSAQDNKIIIWPDPQ